MKKLFLLFIILTLNFNLNAANIYYKIDPKVYDKSLIIGQLNTEEDPNNTEPPVNVISKAYDGLTPISLSISFGENINYRIPSLVDGSGVYTFMHQNDLVITYDKKYEINKIVFGNYCYRPESRYGTLYYWNYENNNWTSLLSRGREDYGYRTYNIPTIITDKFLVLCSWGSERGYTNEFRIYFQ